MWPVDSVFETPGIVERTLRAPVNTLKFMFSVFLIYFFPFVRINVLALRYTVKYNLVLSLFIISSACLSRASCSSPGGWLCNPHAPYDLKYERQSKRSRKPGIAL